MNRITHYEPREGGVPYVVLNQGFDWQDALQRLAAYEDAGLEPWKVDELAKENIPAAIDRLIEYESVLPLGKARKWAQAWEDGRLVMLPCKIGDVLYFIDRYHGEICKTAYVDGIGIYWTNLSDIGDYIPTSVIGKSVFLTQDEAALLDGRMKYADTKRKT